MTCAINSISSNSIPTNLPKLAVDGSIVKNDDKKKTTHQHYFAIGAMMNPTSVKNRKLNLELNAKAVPGYLMDHKLAFFGSSGFAEVIYEKGSVMHGVVYREVPTDQMKTLDNIERDYIRKSVTIHCYPRTKGLGSGGGECDTTTTKLSGGCPFKSDDGGMMIMENVSVYCRSPEDIEESRPVDQPPSERYLQVLMEGARHYGVDPAYVQELEEHECRPRPPPSEFLSFPEVDGWKDRLMTREEVDQKGTGSGGKPLYVVSQGRVVELLQDPSTAILQRDYSESFLRHGRDVELFMSKVQYDPQFGIPSCMEEVTPELAAITEHSFCEYFKGCNAMEKWRVIARIQD